MSTSPIQKLPLHLLGFGVSPWLTTKELAQGSLVCKSWCDTFSRNETLYNYFERNALPAIKAFTESLALQSKQFEGQVEVLDKSSIETAKKTLTLKSVNDFLNQPVPPITIRSIHDTLGSIKQMFCRLFTQLTPEAYKTIKESVSLSSQFLGNLFNSADVTRTFKEIQQDGNEKTFVQLLQVLLEEKNAVEIGFKTAVNSMSIDDASSFSSDFLWRVNGCLIQSGIHQKAIEFCKWLPSSSCPAKDLQGMALKQTIVNFSPRLDMEARESPLKMEKKCLEDFLSAVRVASKSNREDALQGLYLLSMVTPETDAFRETVELEFRKSKGSGLPTESIFQGWLSCGNFDKAHSIANQSPNKEKMKDEILSAREKLVDQQLLDFYKSNNWVYTSKRNASGGRVVTWIPPLSQPNSFKWDTTSSELIAGSKKGFLGTRKSLKSENASVSESSSTSPSANGRKRKEPAD